MKLVSINLGSSETLPSALYQKPTGIQKRPVSSAEVLTSGLQGDFVADQRHHGGPDQAVYLYTVPDYDWWTAELGLTLEPGSFGENLTIAGLESAALCIGDRLRVGTVLLQISAPRIPCNTLAARMDDAQFVKRFRAAARPGAYCRVLEPGTVRVGDAVTLEAVTAAHVRLVEVFKAWYDDQLGPSELERLLRAPLAVRAADAFREHLERRRL